MFRKALILTVLGLAATVPVQALAQAGLPYVEQTDDAKTPAGAAEAEKAEDAPPTATEAEPPADEQAATPERVTPTIASQPQLYGLSPGALEERWSERLARLHDGDVRQADALLEAIVEAKKDSGWPNASAVGLATASEALDAASEGNAERAVRLAQAARELAPLEPRVHLIESRVRWTHGDFGGSSGALIAALRASWANPWELRMRLANLGIGVATALLLAMFLFALASVYRHFGSLRQGLSSRFPGGFSRAQSAIAVAAVLLAPVLIGVGLVWTLAVWSAIGAFYYGARERLAAVLVITYLAALPHFLPFLLQPVGYTGSRAHDAFLAATDIGAASAAARLAAQPKPEPDEFFILGLRALWSGDVNRAAEWLQRAAAQDERTPELYVSLGNIEYARGNIEEATRVYKLAIERDPENVMALFNLSRLKFSQTEQQEAGELHRRANEIDYATVERWSEEAKRIGPTYVVRPTVPRRMLDRGHHEHATMQEAASDIWLVLSGGTTPQAFILGAGAALLFLALGALYRRRVGSRGGRGRKQPLERIRLEIEVHRHQARIARLQKVFAVLFAGAGQLIGGRSVLGLVFATVFISCVLLALTVLELVPQLVPYDGAPRSLAFAFAIIGALACYGLSLWDNAKAEG